MLARCVMLAMFAVAAMSAAAQNVSQTTGVLSRATVIASDGRYKACGLRFVGFQIDKRNPTFPALGWDFNLTIANFDPATLAVMLKTEMSRVDKPEDARTPKLVKVADTWLQVEGAPAVKAVKSGVPGENGLSSMTVYEVDAWPEHLFKMASGQPVTMLLGVRLGDESATRIYRFTPEVRPEDGTAFAECTKAMTEQLRRGVERR